jgi:hypothetical protein
VLSRKNELQSVYILITGTWEYVILWGERDVADVINGANLVISTDYADGPNLITCILKSGKLFQAGSDNVIWEHGSFLLFFNSSIKMYFPYPKIHHAKYTTEWFLVFSFTSHHHN